MCDMDVFLWEMHTPQTVLNGRKSIRDLPSILLREKVMRPFVVIDGELEKTDFGAEIKAMLKSRESTYWNSFSSDPTIEQVSRGSAHLQEAGADSVIAIGGGSAIDAAKYLALISGSRLLAAVPTTCGTGAECSPIAIIKDEQKNKKMAFKHHLFIPKYVILDPNGLNSLSQEMIAATALDTLAHLLETHTSCKSNELVRISTRGSLVSMGNYLQEAIFEKDQTALECLQYVAFTARLLYPGTGLSIIHSLAHPLGAYTGLHHGMAVALLMPAAIEFNRPRCPDLFNEVEALLGVRSPGGDGLSKWIKGLMAKSHLLDIISLRLRQGSIAVESIATQAMESSNLPSNPRKINCQAELVGVLEASLELVSPDKAMLSCDSSKATS